MILVYIVTQCLKFTNVYIIVISCLKLQKKLGLLKKKVSGLGLDLRLFYYKSQSNLDSATPRGIYIYIIKYLDRFVGDRSAHGRPYSGLSFGWPPHGLLKYPRPKVAAAQHFFLALKFIVSKFAVPSSYCGGLMIFLPFQRKKHNSCKEKQFLKTQYYHLHTHLFQVKY
ncbi:hypothetical protein BpHYR1_015630 [Brachionus plicatilis]|uniref:Uncharacterized protein n=1 Tax=Brachionus plicatilis TaxID=10195 RepID=A0A3M7PYQ4_BRAPC|nr:hypothetical protein BpHYR1_015630 [Brachionus plicatilis]